MQRLRVGVIGTGSAVEWAILPCLSGPDALAAPDAGAWWSRRPAPSGDIRYNPPALPEVVALCDGDEPAPLRNSAPTKVSPRLEALARATRGTALYSDARAMLREAQLDVVFLGDECELQPADLVDLISSAPGTPYGVAPPKWVWVDGPPARSCAHLNPFARVAGAPSLWMALPLRRAPAHRAARRLIERDAIGTVTAVQARFPFPLDEARFSSAYAAFDLMLSFFPPAQVPRQIWATRHGDGATQVLLSLGGGAHVSALFGAADTWNSPLPRIEACGTQGRFLVCEAGRRVVHYVPREGTRTFEPPGLAAHVSGSNLSGYGEDIKAFLSVCADNPAPFNAERALDDAARALSVLEAAFLSVQEHIPVSVEPRGVRFDREVLQSEPSPPARNLTLELI
ncbi:hypothetical protein EON83_08920 [bacterium]|nr:MAG: hypothetical protein EON83_08920 [bacterium]